MLIAEDDPDDQLLIRIVVKEVCPPQTQMQFVEDGIMLLDFLQQKAETLIKPKLIMLDLNMPRKDGREALREIKRDPELAQIPIVILTTSNMEEDILYCQRLGIASYYQKPGSITELRAIMGEVCDCYFNRQE